MASAVIPPRQLAPTVGQVAVFQGVSIRTGSSAGERVQSGLVCRVGDFSFISDNAGCFAGKPFPTNGFLMMLGSFITYVAPESVSSYPTRIVEAEDPLPAALDSVSVPLAPGTVWR